MKYRTWRSKYIIIKEKIKLKIPIKRYMHLSQTGRENKKSGYRVINPNIIWCRSLGMSPSRTEIKWMENSRKYHLLVVFV